MTPPHGSAEHLRRISEAAALEKLAAILETGASWFLLFQIAVLIGLAVSGQL